MGGHITSDCPRHSEPLDLSNKGEITDMGSEHYCLRWNNHQSNLLGVFSQLLQDESLVDVTLACAEGLSIRAHKVVLSACSSYFQTLFVDHPNRHPIVILKDVRFAELRTLVEFMYKGEVNVEYCQLSALLKTAESLKVKGLAEMTNAREDNREGDDGASVQKHNSPGPPDTPTPEIPASASGSKRLMDEDSATATSLHPHGSISPSPALYGTKRQMLHHRHDSGSCDEGGGGAGGGTPEPDDLSSPPCAGPSDMSMSCNNPPSCSAAACSSALSSRLPSPLGEEPLPGPSGMLPVQQVPLSLKKEVEWDRGGDDKSTTGDSSSDYRHPHDPEVVMVEGRYGPSCAVAALSRHRGSESQASSRSSTPFQFPFPSFAGGFPGPLVVDPIGAEGTGRPGSSILSLLQQQGLIGSPPLSEDGRNSVGPLPTGLFRCTICLAAFPSAWLLEQHSNLQHSLQSMQEDGESGEEKPFRCDQCGQSYRYRSAYLKHREQNHRARLPADKLFTCDVCGMQFRYLKSFKKHRLNHALERLHAKPDLFNASRKFLAEPSSVDYSSKMLTMMMQGGRPNGDVLTSYGVRESGRVTAPPTSTVTESVGSDQVSSSNEAVGSNAVEETPGTSFERSASVPVSKTEQHNFYKFSLDDYYYYGSGSNLAEGSGSKKKSDRLVMDSGDQDETIDSLAFALSMASNSGSGAGTAGEVFRSAQEASLLNLLRLDAAERQRERRFACPFCGKCVRSKENLKLHVRKHTGERPFVCLFCGRAFGGKSDLTRHLRIHTGERPYHCEMCGKCFARADYLSKHLTTHIHSSQR